MNLSKRKIWAINITLSLTMTVLMFIFQRDMIICFGNFMLKINSPLIGMSYNPLDILIFSCIPIWTYPLYIKRTNLTGKLILITNIIALLIVKLSFIIGLILISYFGVRPSMFLPKSIIFIPFPYFQTVTFIIGIVLTYFFFFIIKLIRKKILNNPT